MKKLKSALLVERAIGIEELPVLVPRPLAAKFAFLSNRTFKTLNNADNSPRSSATRDVLAIAGNSCSNFSESPPSP